MNESKNLGMHDLEGLIHLLADSAFGDGIHGLEDYSDETRQIRTAAIALAYAADIPPPESAVASESIQHIAKEIRAAAGDFEQWGHDVLEGFSTRLEQALQADAREKGEASEQALIAAYKRGAQWAHENHYQSQDYLAKAARDYADKYLATQPAQASEADKPAECADGCPPYQVCDYCQGSAGTPDIATSSQETASE